MLWSFAVALHVTIALLVYLLLVECPSIDVLLQPAVLRVNGAHLDALLWPDMSSDPPMSPNTSSAPRRYKPTLR